MAYLHVNLSAAGTSGDGSTWADDSSGTAVYVGVAGLKAACVAASLGDTLFVKNSGSSAAHLIVGKTTGNVNPIKIFGVLSATTNLGASVVTADLIPGIRTGQATRAYDHAEVPVATITGGSSDNAIQNCYIYGMSFISEDNNAAGYDGGTTIVEECNLEVTGSGDIIYLGDTSATVKTINSLFKGVSGSGIRFDGQGSSGEHIGSIFSIPGTLGVLGVPAISNDYGHHYFRGCDFADGGETTIVYIHNLHGAEMIFENCLFPASWVFTASVGTGTYRVESYGSDDTTGLTTSGSEQQMNISTTNGTIVTETTKVRTGGADDGAAGVVSWDMSTVAVKTVVGILSLFSPWMYIWVSGDGTSKTLTVYFTSDSGNTRGTDWNDNEIWLQAIYPDDGGTSKHDYVSNIAQLLATGSAVTDDAGSTWGAGTQNDQKLTVSIAPDYEGYVKCRVHFAPGANAETIYVDPLPTVV